MAAGPTLATAKPMMGDSELLDAMTLGDRGRRMKASRYGTIDDADFAQLRRRAKYTARRRSLQAALNQSASSDTTLSSEAVPETPDGAPEPAPMRDSMRSLQAGDLVAQALCEVLVRCTDGPAWKWSDEFVCVSQSISFPISAFSPAEFAALRSVAGVTTEDVLLSLGSAPLSSQLGAGKSGCLFFTTADRAFVLKTIKASEKSTFTRFMPSYYEYMTAPANRNSYICRFLGVIELRLPSEAPLCLVLMRNVLATQLSVRDVYDLKGSSVNRRVRDVVVVNDRVVSVRKDCDLATHVLIGSLKRPLLKMLYRDVQFLRSVAVMDYSLLLGVAHSPVPVESVAAVEAPIAVRASMIDATDMGSDLDFDCCGGYRGRGRNDAPRKEVYYLGIIDLLQKFTLMKRAERTLKTLVVGAAPEALSVMAVDDYADRFMRRMQTLFVDVNDLGGEYEPPDYGIHW
eukprot:c17485_g1_i1.p2 GENE.c17485_g1_i1~~c17485_g1_i1.p2  ORF type:complete len:458 (-),score=67.21 c17485_g1_i1:673-2046(-)